MPSSSINVIKVKQGTTPVINLTLTDNTNPEQPTVDDITGSTIFFTVKINKTDTDAAAVISKKWTPTTGGGYDTTKGQTFVDLSALDTNLTPGSYFYDVREIKSTGTIMNADRGAFIVELPITTRTS